MLFDFPATHYMLFTITLLTLGSGTADIFRTAPEVPQHSARSALPPVRTAIRWSILLGSIGERNEPGPSGLLEVFPIQAVQRLGHIDPAIHFQHGEPLIGRRVGHRPHSGRQVRTAQPPLLRQKASALDG